MRSRRDGRSEWVQGHLAEAARIATFLTADLERGRAVAEESLASALQLVPRRKRDGRLADALLLQLVRRSRTDAAPAAPGLPEQLTSLRELPRRQRAALVLSHYAEMSDERAAVFLGCSPRATADLADKAVRALPAEARPDVHEWLDATPLPRITAALPRRARWRRVVRPRVVRAAGAVAAVVLGVVAGLRLPGLLTEPEPPTRAERVAEVRRLVEMREAKLPFDPDDPGPGSTRMFPVVDGVIGGSLWTVSGYRNPAGVPCLQLVVAFEFGSRRCVGATGEAINALVDVDRDHDATFISGMVSPGVAALHFRGPGVSWMDVTIGRADPDTAATEPGFFGIALPGELVPLDPREASRDPAYEVMPGRLTALDADGKEVAALSLLLAKA